VLAAVREAAPDRLAALETRGEALDMALPIGPATWRIEGRSSAGDAWLRLSPLENPVDLSGNGPGLLADASPDRRPSLSASRPR